MSVETVQQYQCPNCGAQLRFDPKKQGFGCEYCGSYFTSEECKAANEKIRRQEEDTAPAKAAFEEQTNLYYCPSCAAELATDQNTAATECVYCHNPVVLKGRLSGEYRPAQIIPFKLTREDAERIFHEFCKKHWFLPRTFTAESQLLHMQGVYVPFWVAACDVHGKMQAVCKKVRTWTSGGYQYTETREFDVFRDASVHFDGIPADGASKIEDALMEAVEPFDYRDAKDFEMTYLSGFLSDKYDVNKAQVFPRIKNRAVNGSDHILRSSMTGYSSVRVVQSDMNLLNTQWKYMLLPVWFMTYEYRGQRYSFAINGQTGKQAGTPPLAVGRLAGVCAGIVAAVTILGFIGGTFL